MTDVPNNLDNTYYEGRNHVRLARDDVTPENLLTAAVNRATSLGKTVEVGARGIGVAAPFSTHEMVIGTSAGGAGFQLNSFGALTPATFDNDTITRIFVSSTGRIEVISSGRVRFSSVAGNLAVDFVGSGIAPLSVPWNATANLYRLDGQTVLRDYLLARIGVEIPVDLGNPL